jgi:hypothetical protein
MSLFDRCCGCRKPFKRLSTHIAQNAACAGYNGTTAHKSSLPIPNNIHANTYAQEARKSLDLDSNSCQADLHPTLRKSAVNAGQDKLPPVADKNEVKGDFMVDDDNNVVLPFDDNYPDAVDDSASGSNEEEDQADQSVLD